MNIYPAIDLLGGRCVRLTEGDFATEVRYDFDPIVLASTYADAGAKYLHVVDLDGARAGACQQADLMFRMVQASGLKAQVGGGIRTVEDAAALIDGGVERVVIGSLALSQRDVAQELIASLGPERVTLALDVRTRAGTAPELATHGWQRPVVDAFWDVLLEYARSGIRHVLCTDIGRDGKLGGPNVALYAQMTARFPELQIQASGGVATVRDLRALRDSGVASAIVGKALLEGRMTLAEALAC